MKALLEAAGVAPEDVYITHAVACAPDVGGAGGGFSKEPEAAAAVLSCLPRLQWEIQQAKPRVILPLGNVALLALTGHAREKVKAEKFPCSVCDPGKRSKRCVVCGGRKTRSKTVSTIETEHKINWVAGAVFDAKDAAPWLAEAGVAYVIPTFHPSFLLIPAETVAQSSVGGQFVAPSVVAHLQKAKALLVRDRDWSLEVTVTDIPADVEEYTKEPGLYAIDIETDAKEPFEVTSIKCIGIGRIDRAEVLVVDTSNVTDMNDPLLLALMDFLEDPKKEKILQNRQYDEMVIELRWDIIVAGTVFDTMLAHHALCPDEPHNLQRIATTYTETPAWKPPKNKNGMEAFASEEEFWIYNARDVRNTALSARAMKVELATEHLTQVHAMDLRMATIAMEMQRCGVPIDQEKRVSIGAEHRVLKSDALGVMREYVEAWRIPRAESVEELLAEGDTEAASALQRILDEGGDPTMFNPESPVQLRWALFDKSGPCKLTSTMLTGKKRLASTSKDALRSHSQHEFVATLRAYQDSKRVLSNYIDSNGFRLGPDGRMHPAWKVHGTVTGRWSSSPNFQNLDELIKTMFVSRPGYVWVGADYAQLELRIIAALSGDETLIKLCLEADENDKLNPDRDPHSYVARLAFGRAFMESDQKARKALRDGIKAVVYGMNYGAGASKIQQTIMLDEAYKGPPLTVEMVTKIMAAYFKGFGRVKTYRDRAVSEATKARAVFSPLLRRRRSFPLGEVEAPTAMNFGIQAGAADLVDDAVDTLHKALPAVDEEAALLAQVHDALYVECREEHGPAVAQCLERSMYRKIRLVSSAPEMEFIAKAKIGPGWASVS
jgi:DNA polymerase I-like protein with 3'-5' exonuclease and polymerase domains